VLIGIHSLSVCLSVSVYSVYELPNNNNVIVLEMGRLLNYQLVCKVNHEGWMYLLFVVQRNNLATRLSESEKVTSQLHADLRSARQELDRERSKQRETVTLSDREKVS